MLTVMPFPDSAVLSAAAAAVVAPVLGAAAPDTVVEVPVQGVAAPDVPVVGAPDAAASATAAAGAPELGSAAPDSAAAGAPELGTAAPDAVAAEAPETSAAAEAPTSSSGPVAEEELEVVFGRQLLQLQPPEEEATPLPQVLVQVRRSIEEATCSAEAAFRRE